MADDSSEQSIRGQFEPNFPFVIGAVVLVVFMMVVTNFLGPERAELKPKPGEYEPAVVTFVQHPELLVLALVLTFGIGFVAGALARWGPNDAA